MTKYALRRLSDGLYDSMTDPSWIGRVSPRLMLKLGSLSPENVAKWKGAVK